MRSRPRSRRRAWPSPRRLRRRAGWHRAWPLLDAPSPRAHRAGGDTRTSTRRRPVGRLSPLRPPRSRWRLRHECCPTRPRTVALLLRSRRLRNSYERLRQRSGSAAGDGVECPPGGRARRGVHRRRSARSPAGCSGLLCRYEKLRPATCPPTPKLTRPRRGDPHRLAYRPLPPRRDRRSPQTQRACRRGRVRFDRAAGRTTRPSCVTSDGARPRPASHAANETGHRGVQ